MKKQKQIKGTTLLPPMIMPTRWVNALGILYAMFNTLKMDGISLLFICRTKVSSWNQLRLETNSKESLHYKPNYMESLLMNSRYVAYYLFAVSFCLAYLITTNYLICFVCNSNCSLRIHSWAMHNSVPALLEMHPMNGQLAQVTPSSSRTRTRISLLGTTPIAQELPTRFSF